VGGKTVIGDGLVIIQESSLSNLLNITFGEDAIDELKAYRLYVDGQLKREGNITSNVISMGVNHLLSSGDQEVRFEVDTKDGTTLSGIYIPTTAAD